MLLAGERRARESSLEDKVRARTAELSEENARRRHSERRLAAQLERMSLLDHITRAIAERQDLRSIFQVVIRNVEENLPAQVCWIGLAGADTAGLPLRRGTALPAGPAPRALALPPSAGAAGPRRLGQCTAARRERHHRRAAGGSRPAALPSAAASANSCASSANMSASPRARRNCMNRCGPPTRNCARRRRRCCSRSGSPHSARWPVASPTTSTIPSPPRCCTWRACWNPTATLSPRARQSLPLVLQAIEDVAATVARLREFYRPREMQAVHGTGAAEPAGGADRGAHARTLERHAAAARHRHHRAQGAGAGTAGDPGLAPANCARH